MSPIFDPQSPLHATNRCVRGFNLTLVGKDVQQSAFICSLGDRRDDMIWGQTSEYLLLTSSQSSNGYLWGIITWTTQ